MAKHWKEEYFDYPYMGAYSLMAEDGQTHSNITVTIKDIKVQEVVGEKGKKEKLPVAYFNETEKPMVLNKTNCKSIQQLTGIMIGKGWIGQSVVLTVEKVKSHKGGFVNALRVDVKSGENIIKKTQSIKLQIKGASTIDQLSKIYKENESLFTSNLELQEAIKGKKEAIKNPDQQTA